MKAKNFPFYSVLLIDSFAAFLVLPIIFYLVFESPFFPELAAVSMKTKWTLFSAIVIAFPLGQCLGVPLIANRSDYIRGKPLFFIALTGETVGLFLSFLALFFKSINGFIISRLVTGFFTASFALCFSYLTHESQEIKTSKKTTAFGVLSVTIGFVLAVFVATFFSDKYLGDFTDPRLAFIFATTLGLINILVVAISKTPLFEKVVVPKASQSAIFLLKKVLHEHPTAGRSVLVLVLLFMSIGAPLSFFSSMVFGIYSMSKLMLLMLLFLVAGAWMLGFLITFLFKGLSKSMLTLSFFGLFAISCWLFFEPQPVVFGILFTLFQLLASMLTTSFTTRVVASTPTKFKGLCMGSAQVVSFFAAALSPMLALFFVIFLRPERSTNLFLVSIVFSLIAALYLLLLKKPLSEKV